jgi:hypothetical protein
MKLRKLRKKMYKAIFAHDGVKEKQAWLKILKKSHEHKHTEDVQ